MHRFILGLVVVVAVAAGGWFAWQSQSSAGLADISASAGSKLTDDQVSRVVARVSHFIVVPTGENPSVTVLNDAAGLAASNTFYQDAKDGDVLVVFSSRAVIYDPRADKLVTVGPVDRVGDISGTGGVAPTPSATPSTTPVPPEKATIDVRNGTTTAGLAGSTANDLKQYSWVTIGNVGDAKGSYTQTVIIDLTAGKKPGAAAALADEFEVSVVSELPTGETASTADFLIIIGK